MDNSRTGKQGIIWLGSVLFIFALFLTAYSSKRPEVARSGFTLLSRVVAPAQSSTSSVYSWFSDVWNGYIALTGVVTENHELSKRLELLERQNAFLREFESQNKDLRALLSMRAAESLEGSGAVVIGYDPTSWIKTFIINRGSADGLVPRQAVVQASGLVGQVIAVAPHSAQVLLITDSSSGVDALVQRSRTRGVVVGRGRQKCQMLYVPNGEDVHEGDVIISSGMDGIFPKGLIIGKVSDVGTRSNGLFQDVDVRPVVDFDMLEHVFVVSRSHASPSDSTLEDGLGEERAQ